MFKRINPKPGEHLLFVDGALEVRTPGESEHTYQRAMQAYAKNPAAEIMHVVVLTTYAAPSQPEIKTLAEARMK